MRLITPVPCEANPVRLAAFLAEQLRPLLARAEVGQAVVYFADAAHLTQQPRATLVRTRTGQPRPLPTVSGRERTNLNETDCVNAQSTTALYEKLWAAHPDGPPIYVICGNARHYRNRELANWLQDKPLVQVFLPLYSPNLNLIERLWKFLRQQSINHCIYRTKGAFRQVVHGYFNRLDEFGHKPISLLSLNFHLFELQTTL